MQTFSYLILHFLPESESGSGVDIDPNLPYPGIAPIALGYLSQTTRPRSWCLALISNPYPFDVAIFESIDAICALCLFVRVSSVVLMSGTEGKCPLNFSRRMIGIFGTHLWSLSVG